MKNIILIYAEAYGEQGTNKAVEERLEKWCSRIWKDISFKHLCGSPKESQLGPFSKALVDARSVVCEDQNAIIVKQKGIPREYVLGLFAGVRTINEINDMIIKEKEISLTTIILEK